MNVCFINKNGRKIVLWRRVSLIKHKRFSLSLKKVYILANLNHGKINPHNFSNLFYFIVWRASTRKISCDKCHGFENLNVKIFVAFSAYKIELRFNEHEILLFCVEIFTCDKTDKTEVRSSAFFSAWPIDYRG